jgi:hypothetical protein
MKLVSSSSNLTNGHSSTFSPHKAAENQMNKNKAQSHGDVQHQHHHVKKGSSLLLWILLDGIGLCLVAACTILEGMVLWWEYFHDYWPDESTSIMLWGTGRSFQILGIMFLIVYALTFWEHNAHWMEVAGMACLTIGPIVNMCACNMFEAKNTNDDDMDLLHYQWLTWESVELFGIFLLDISLIEFEDEVVLAFEIAGFFFLCCAAMLDYDYSDVDFENAYFFIPVPSLRSGVCVYIICVVACAV